MAATALDLSFPFDDGDTLEDNWRAMASLWLTDGPVRGKLNSFLVTTATGRNVTISSGHAWLNGEFGALLADAVQPIAVNGTGNARIDRIVLRVVFASNLVYYDVLQGTPAGSPTAPALTQNTTLWEISLAQIAVAAGFSSLGAGTITDERRWASGRPPGGPALIACAAVRTTNFPVGDSTDTFISFDSAEEYDTAAIHDLGANQHRFTVPGGCKGLWTFTVKVAWEYSTAHNRGVVVYVNGVSTETLEMRLTTDNTVPDRTTLPWEAQLNPGDYVQFAAYQDSGSSKNITRARATARYVGSLVG